MPVRFLQHHSRKAGTTSRSNSSAYRNRHGRSGWPGGGEPAYIAGMKRRLGIILSFVLLALIVVAGLIRFFLPEIGAAMLLHPLRIPVSKAPPSGCVNSSFQGHGVEISGWSGAAQVPARGTVIYLHGISDNRASGAGICERFLKAGFDVIAYDSRGHGGSEGELCTYGFHEKMDLLKIVAGVRHPPVVLLGSSMGAAVALQAAAMNPAGIATVIAAETFCDLDTITRERSPFFMDGAVRGDALEIAERKGGFQIAAVSPLAAAGNIGIPVLIIHGADDMATPPEHSRRVYHALKGAKRLILVPDAGHGQSLGGGFVWGEIDRWVDELIPRKAS